MSTIESADTGSATANHEPQSSGGSIAASAIRFCGDEMGELCPPMLAASAMPSCASARPREATGGRRRQRGRWTSGRCRCRGDETAVETQGVPRIHRAFRWRRPVWSIEGQGTPGSGQDPRPATIHSVGPGQVRSGQGTQVGVRSSQGGRGNGAVSLGIPVIRDKRSRSGTERRTTSVEACGGWAAFTTTLREGEWAHPSGGTFCILIMAGTHLDERKA